MSIRSEATVRLLRAGCALALAAPALLASARTQEPDSLTPEEMIANARERTAIPEAEPVFRKGCGLTSDGEIVVCAPLENPDTLRLPSRLSEGDDSHLSWDGRAPDVTGPYVFSGPATAGGMCFFGPCPKPPVYIVDVEALPLPPPGSDAEAIAQGRQPAP